MWLCMMLGTAAAFDGDAVVQRVSEVAPLRSQRLGDVAPSFTETQYRAAAAGEVVTGVFAVEGNSAKVGYGLGVLDVGIDALWAGLNDETKHTGLSPISFVEVVEGKVCADKRHVLMVLPLPMISDRFWVNENAYNAAIAAASSGAVRELAWNSLSDPASHAMSADAKAAVSGLTPVSFNRGAWLLIALDDTHTLAEYHSWVDPGGYVPASGASMFATSGISDTFEAMETFAKKGALQCLEAK